MNQKTVKELIHQIEKAADAIGSTYCRLNDTLDAFYAILADAGSSVQSVQSVKRGKGPRMRKIEEPGRLPDIPDWRDGAARQEADDELTRIRLTVAGHQGDGLAEIIEAIKAGGTDPKALAAILGVNQARISEALHGKARPGFVARFAEVLGEGGAAGAKAANNKTYKTYKTHKKNAVAKAAGRDHRSGKRGAK